MPPTYTFVYWPHVPRKTTMNSFGQKQQKILCNENYLLYRIYLTVLCVIKAQLEHLCMWAFTLQAFVAVWLDPCQYRDTHQTASRVLLAINYLSQNVNTFFTLPTKYERSTVLSKEVRSCWPLPIRSLMRVLLFQNKYDQLRANVFHGSLPILITCTLL